MDMKPLRCTIKLAATDVKLLPPRWLSASVNTTNHQPLLEAAIVDTQSLWKVAGKLSNDATAQAVTVQDDVVLADALL